MLIPKPFKKFLAILRGKVSFLMILLSVTFGFWFGLSPGWSGFNTAILCIVLVLNIHIGLFLLFAGLGKAFLFAAAPLVYHVGLFVHDHLRVLIDLFSRIPVIAMTDFGKISIAGAFILGPAVGVVLGLILAALVRGFRQKYLRLHENSEAFQKWYSKKWVRIVDRILIGKSAADPRQLVQGKGPLIRKPGIALVVVILLIAMLAAWLTPDEKVRRVTADQLTRLNGAEVNLDTFTLAPLAGKLSAGGIQITDPENPAQNKLAAEKLTANASLAGFLMGKVIMDDVEITDLRFDSARQAPGQVIEKPQPAEPEPPFNPGDITGESIEKYVQGAKKIKEWLTRISDYLPASDKKSPAAVRQVPEDYLAYIDARTFLEPAARFIAKRIAFDNIEIPWEPLGRSAVEMFNLSDAPTAYGEPIKIDIQSQETGAALRLNYDFDAAPDTPNLDGGFTGFDLARLGSPGGLQFESGAAAGSVTGKLLANSMDVTLDVKLADMKLAPGSPGLFGLDAATTSEIITAMQNMDLKIRLLGSPKNPQMSVDTGGLAEAFKQKAVEMGKQKGLEQLDKQLEKQVGGKVGEDVKKAVGEGLKGILGGKKEDQ